MDVQNLKCKWDNNYMRKEGYSTSYILAVEYEIKRIIKISKQNDWLSYSDIYESYRNYYSEITLKNKRIYLKLIEHFDVHHTYPNGRNKSSFIRFSSYNKLLPTFKEIVDTYCEIEKENGKTKRTIYTNQNRGSNFFLFLQQKGSNTLEEITETSVQSYFISEGIIQKSYSTKNGISTVLRISASKYPRCGEPIECLPRIRNQRKNIPYFFM